MKAKATGVKYYGKYSTCVEYEYRGKIYEVEYSNCMTYCCSPAKYQHEIKQMEIDKEIDRELNREPGDEDPIDLDEIFKMIGWE